MVDSNERTRTGNSMVVRMVAALSFNPRCSLQARRGGDVALVRGQRHSLALLSQSEKVVSSHL